MGISRWKPIVFLGVILGCAVMLFPSPLEMNFYLRQSQWLDYAVRESRRLWVRHPEDRDSAYSLVLALRQRGDLPQAIRVAKTALQYHPNDTQMERTLQDLYDENFDLAGEVLIAEALVSRGQANENDTSFLYAYYLDHQQWDKLVPMLEADYTGRAYHGELPWELINIYQQRQERGKLRQLYLRHLRHNPESLDAIEGYLSLEEGTPMTAERLTLLRRRCELLPNNIDNALALSEALHQSGDHAGARKELLRAVALKGATLPQVEQMASLASDLNLTDVAETLLIRVAQKSSPAAPWWERVGELALNTGRRDKAERAFLRAYQENPHQGEVARLLAEIAQAQGRTQDAFIYWQVYLEDHPDNREAYLAAGDAILPTQADRAKALFEKGAAIPLKPHDAWDEYLYASLLLRLHQKEKAYALFRQLENEDFSQRVDLVGDLAELSLELGQYDQAQKYLKKLEKTSPHSERFQSLSAQYALAKEDWARAIPLLTELLKKHPHDVSYESDLAWATYNSGDWRSAEGLYRDLLLTQKQAEAKQVLWEITQAHAPHLAASSLYQNGPASKQALTVDGSYTQPWKTSYQWTGGWEEDYTLRRRADNSFDDHIINHPHLSLAGQQAKRWQWETSIHGFFDRDVNAVAPEAMAEFNWHDWTFGGNGFFNLTILDPSEALDVNGRMDLAQLNAKRKWGLWEFDGDVAQRWFHVNASQNTFTGESSLGYSQEAQFSLVRTLLAEAPLVNLGYTFLSSHWEQPFSGAPQLIPWLPNQQAHVGTLYAEQRLKQGPLESVSAYMAGGRDTARDVWLYNVFAETAVRLKEAWRVTFGAGWEKDSGVAGTGSSAALRATVVRYFGP